MHGQNFTPQPIEHQAEFERIGRVPLPKRFIGRRRKLRPLLRQIRHDEFRSLLLTGAGGMGKTALAGKLLLTLRKQGNMIFAFSLSPEHCWLDVVFEMELELKDQWNDMFQKVQAKRLPRRQNTEWLLKLLLQQTGGKLALLFDNLESVQAMGQQPLQDDALAEWLAVAQQFTASGLKLILTSRWHLPDWSEANILSVDGIRYADYKALARTQQLTPSLLDDGKRLHHTHHVLGGNPRALGFFITTTQGMDLQQEPRKIYDARGDYDTALTFLKQSLQIRQEIGDRSGMCATLFNMGHIHFTNDERDDAIGLWLQVYSIAKSINSAQALDALESLAGQLGQEGGLQFWEGLAQQASNNNHTQP